MSALIQEKMEDLLQFVQPFDEKIWDLIKVVQDGVTNFDPLVIGCLVAFIVVVLTILIFAVNGRSKRGRRVLLLGLCDAGKTLIFSQLVLGKFAKTHTSIKENCGQYSVTGNKRGKQLCLLDLPGHERIRLSMVEKYKHDTRGLLFVVDSLTLQKEIKDVAEFIYTLLTDPVLSYHVPPVLIVCNKQDQTMAKSAKVIQDSIEKEINTLRITRSAQLGATDETAGSVAFLGKANRNFSFDDAKPFKITFAECSACGEKQDGPQLEPVERWLESIA